MSNIIKNDSDSSTNQASAEHQLSTDRENEAHLQVTSTTQPSSGAKECEDHGGNTDVDSFSTRWLRVNEGVTAFGNMKRFLGVIGVSDHEDLEALTTSFNGIVQMTGSEHNAATWMELRNALWHATSTPST